MDEAQSYAIISNDQQFRYLLGRRWDESIKPLLVFVMFNPSTADAHEDDATIRKCVGFAKRLGFGRMEVVNLFAYRTRHPDVMRAAGYQGADEKADKYLRTTFENVINTNGTVICAWGTNVRDPVCQKRANFVIQLLLLMGIRPKALRILDDGTPSHPLMLSYNQQLKDLPCSLTA